MFADASDPQGPISLELLKKAIDVSNDGIVIAEQEGDDNILVYVNRAFERMTGYQADEILYQDCRFLQLGDKDQPALEEIRQAMAAGRSARVVLRNYRKDGSLFWNELSLSPVFSDEEQLMYYIGVQKDVTSTIDALQRAEKAEAELAELRQKPA
ncbi:MULTISPECIES: PAS domain-containing protein [unclassified Oceanobacter]|jgi:PAS domain S-box-containing protein|uniref:PAS domain-containing protein n=1 Tax=unclassified Oceanobacter TaxID=2620260 RepID=UPI0026E2C532|nr:MULTISPECIES: PAS domain-containing protein [unclassified Oceanobacter]MDO6681629.1 PAS domain-containing protein [Oceanobacter sp. 5_MG-2023]MDP2505743.1 PAS domain-containing protein [Oceanobacter sp. 3_MG-2023]MDP2547430.1 PAS domain-containing protein [Oceanobacter sp. 4_MG-2023]MDP2608218.1 PAS domain-containing protein [Oceanobacter sp. 1_MG-2023]MDP2612944.1 PAS domain-containing protein [Oceanobacter sp. 2_MG-2023]